MPTPSLFRFPFIRPVMPRREAWSHFLEPAYAAKRYSNVGPVVNQFEAGLTERLCHEGEVITSASSCTSGLAAALIALQTDGRILIPAFTFPATASAVLMAGCEPCVIDVDLQTWAISPSELERVLSRENYAAVVLVVPFGVRRDFTEHHEICRGRGVPVIIDNASGLNGKEAPLPNERCLEVYSLHATKAFAIGEGGAIRSLSSQREALRRGLNFGLQNGVAQPGCWGINGKLPEVSAAVGLAVLERFDEFTERRRMIARRYIELLGEFGDLAHPTSAESAPWQAFPLLLPCAKTATSFIASTAHRSVQVHRGYRPSLEHWPRTRPVSACPNAGSLAERMVLLPVYADGTNTEVEELVGIVRVALSEVRGN